MANTPLLVSSVCMAIWHAALFWLYPGSATALYLLGMCTSVWNHGTTSRRARLADRAVIAFGAAVDALCLGVGCFGAGCFGCSGCTLFTRNALAAALIVCIASYFASKAIGVVWLHIATHAILSGVHAVLLSC